MFHAGNLIVVFFQIIDILIAILLNGMGDYTNFFLIGPQGIPDGPSLLQRGLKIPLKNILYFKSDRKKISAVMINGTEEFYGKLSDIENDLPDHFIRIHNRYLVNTAFVSRLTSTSCICGDEELPVSRAYRQELSVAFARMMLT